MRVEHQAARGIDTGIGDPGPRPRCGLRVAQQLPAAFIRPVLRRKIDALAVGIGVANELVDLVVQQPVVVQNLGALGERGELVGGVVGGRLECIVDRHRTRADDVSRERKPQRNAGGGFSATQRHRQRKRLHHRADDRIVLGFDQHIAGLATHPRSDDIDRGQVGIGQSIDPIEDQRAPATHGGSAAFRAGRHGHRRGAAGGINRSTAVDGNAHVAADAGLACAVSAARQIRLHIVQHVVAAERHAHRHRQGIAAGRGRYGDRARLHLGDDQRERVRIDGEVAARVQILDVGQVGARIGSHLVHGDHGRHGD